MPARTNRPPSAADKTYSTAFEALRAGVITHPQFNRMVDGTVSKSDHLVAQKAWAKAVFAGVPEGEGNREIALRLRENIDAQIAEQGYGATQRENLKDGYVKTQWQDSIAVLVDKWSRLF